MKILATTIASFVFFATAGGVSASDDPRHAMWTGYYVGVNVGHSWGRSGTDIDVLCAQSGVALCNAAGDLLYAAHRSSRMDGIIGGVQAGRNWQIKKWVLGIEADVMPTGQRGSLSFACVEAVCNAGDTSIDLNVLAGTLERKLKWLGTVRGRVGLTGSPWFAYVTGGLAVGRIETSGRLSGVTVGGLPTETSFSGGTTKVGWTVGGGFERAIGNSDWSLKVDYLYVDLGSVSDIVPFTTTFPAVNVVFGSRVTDNILRVGLNRRFGALRE
jgi:outer membrane immunogenic protein